MASTRPDGGALLSIRGLCKSFGDHAVLRDFELDVRRGEVLTILGPSGCGKSVLLKIVVGLLAADAGTIVFDGANVERMSTSELTAMRQRVGIVFQNAALFDSVPVADNVAYGLREHARETHSDEHAIAERVTWALAAVGMAGTEAMMPADLSGGMRKRVAVARTIAVRPEVLLYDEPTTGLDPINAARIARLILSLKAQLAITSVIVTHDMATAFRVSDRIGLIDDGRLVALDTAAAIRASQDVRVRAFIDGRDDGTLDATPP